MRTSFVVGIFTLAVAIAGTTEWASRRATGKTMTDASSVDQTSSGTLQPGSGRAPAEKTGGATTAPAGGAHDTLQHHPDETTGSAKDTLILQGDDGFRLNSVNLTDAALASIDAMFTGLGTDLIGAQFVIEGHTDSLGAKDVNEKIGLARALAVRQYLSEQYEIPRELVKVVSYGADQPIADNATQEGRTLNRRVVIKVVH